MTTQHQVNLYLASLEACLLNTDPSSDPPTSFKLVIEPRELVDEIIDHLANVDLLASYRGEQWHVDRLAVQLPYPFGRRNKVSALRVQLPSTINLRSWMAATETWIVSRAQLLSTRINQARESITQTAKIGFDTKRVVKLIDSKTYDKCLINRLNERLKNQLDSFPVLDSTIIQRREPKLIWYPERNCLAIDFLWVSETTKVRPSIRCPECGHSHDCSRTNN